MYSLSVPDRIIWTNCGVGYAGEDVRSVQRLLFLISFPPLFSPSSPRSFHRLSFHVVLVKPSLSRYQKKMKLLFELPRIIQFWFKTDESLSSQLVVINVDAPTLTISFCARPEIDRNNSGAHVPVCTLTLPQFFFIHSFRLYFTIHILIRKRNHLPGVLSSSFSSPLLVLQFNVGENWILKR